MCETVFLNYLCMLRKLEQFSHRYRYDADNRVSHVYTSNIFKIKRDSAVSQERLEARYFYLPTGALSRIELGHKQIQGVDYAYTLQGWLKDINGYRGSGTDMYESHDSFDIGNDGVIQTGNVNRLFAHDGYASSIQYYQDDYSPVAGSDYFNDYSQDAVSLYNGNISALSESIYNLGERGFMKLFRYDKLNRIKRMRTAVHHQNDPGWESASDNFATDYSYDWNGNLLSLQRKNQYLCSVKTNLVRRCIISDIHTRMATIAWGAYLPPVLHPVPTSTMHLVT